MITTRDVRKMMEGHADGFLEGDAASWLKANGISERAFSYICSQLEQTLKEGLADGAIHEIMESENADPALMMKFAIQAIIGAAFTVGWELHMEYGEKAAPDPKLDLLRGLDFPTEEP